MLSDFHRRTSLKFVLSAEKPTFKFDIFSGGRTLRRDTILQFGVEDAANNFFSFVVPMPIDGWTQIAATLDIASGTLRLYTNGFIAKQANTAIRPLGPLSANATAGVGL